jgi:hypothetical protein
MSTIDCYRLNCIGHKHSGLFGYTIHLQGHWRIQGQSDINNPFGLVNDDDNSRMAIRTIPHRVALTEHHQRYPSNAKLFELILMTGEEKTQYIIP